MFHSSFTLSAFEAMVEEIGKNRSPLDPIRTAAHAACARRRNLAQTAPESVRAAVLRAIAGDPARYDGSIRH